METRDMACHTWALSGNTTVGEGERVHQQYEDMMNSIGALYEYGENLRGKTLAQIRQETMDGLLQICEVRTRDTTHNVFLCGGFRGGQVCPEHLWLEDHTSNMTYDTFINQPVRSIHQVGVPGQPFRPPCEGSPFQGNEIARVQINGYTDGQYSSLP